MIDIGSIATNLKSLDGIWYSKNNTHISYPDKGNAECFSIEDNSFWFTHRNNCILVAMKKYPPNGILFDIGGGNGFVSLGLKNNGYDVALVEPGIEGIHNARLRGLTSIICSTLEEAGFIENSMPAIGLFDVLEHIRDDAGVLKLIRSLLIPNGRLYITVPAHKILWSNEDNLAGHYRRYTLKELEYKLKMAGYEVEYSTYFFTLLMIPILLFRTIPTRIGLRKSGNHNKYQKEHKIDFGLINIPLHSYFNIELSRIRNNKIGIGASCIIVAKVKK